MSVITEDSLTCASSSSFSTRCISRVRSRISDRRYAEVRVMPSGRVDDRGVGVFGWRTSA
jgi:hypothetical protein